VFVCERAVGFDRRDEAFVCIHTYMVQCRSLGGCASLWPHFSLAAGDV
jgi:hypothetical protein